MYKFRFSIFTATYNRAEYLPRVYNSLKDQTFKDFEWIIVDDGSTDNTEELVNSFINEKVLKSIKYIKKENGGKHTAWRVATNVFNSKYVVTIDSDDTLTPHALEIFDKYWRELENSPEYESFWEVKARAQYENGKLVGPPFISKVFDATAIEFTFKYKYKGDLHGCRKSIVLKNEAKVPDKFMFEKSCSNFPESIRWLRAGKIYKSRYIEEITEIVNTTAKDRLSKSGKHNLKHTYNNLISAKYHIEENREYMLKWDKISYIKTIIILLYMAFRININPFKIMERTTLLDVFLIIIMYFPTFILYKIRK